MTDEDKRDIYQIVKGKEKDGQGHNKTTTSTGQSFFCPTDLNKFKIDQENDEYIDHVQMTSLYNDYNRGEEHQRDTKLN